MRMYMPECHATPITQLSMLNYHRLQEIMHTKMTEEAVDFCIPKPWSTESTSKEKYRLQLSFTSERVSDLSIMI